MTQAAIKRTEANMEAKMFEELRDVEKKIETILVGHGYPAELEYLCKVCNRTFYAKHDPRPVCCGVPVSRLEWQIRTREVLAPSGCEGANPSRRNYTVIDEAGDITPEMVERFRERFKPAPKTTFGDLKPGERFRMVVELIKDDEIYWNAEIVEGMEAIECDIFHVADDAEVERIEQKETKEEVLCENAKVIKAGS